MIVYERTITAKMPEGMRPRSVLATVTEKFATRERFVNWYEDNVGKINDAVKAKVDGVAMGLTRITFTKVNGEKDCYLNDCRA